LAAEEKRRKLLATKKHIQMNDTQTAILFNKKQKLKETYKFE
jgi:hypothetical protein